MENLCYDAVISVRQSEKTGNTYLRLWHPEYGAILICDKSSFDKVVKAAGGWTAGNLVKVVKEGTDGQWEDLQFKGVFSLELKLRVGNDAMFATVVSAEKQKAFTMAIPKGVETRRNEESTEPDEADEAEEVEETPKAKPTRTVTGRRTTTAAPF